MLNNEAWADAADRQLLRLKATNNSMRNSKSVQFETSQPQSTAIYDSSLGSMSSSSQDNESLPYSSQSNKSNDQLHFTVILNLTKESGPLGIHVLPDTNTGSNTVLRNGLCIQNIEPGGRIDRDGRLHIGDTIVEVNDNKFANLDFARAQEIFRDALQRAQIKLKIYKSRQQNNQTLSDICDTNSVRTSQNNIVDQQNVDTLVECEERAGQQAKLAALTPTRKHSAGIISKPLAPAIVMANTRRVGKKYHIQLKKGQSGLGFTITTRDNPTSGQVPIIIKTILPRGAAIQDGRLKPGDRLLEVCGIEMTGKSQDDAVKILRNLPMDSIVDIIVSRQEVEMSPSPLMPRQLPPEKANEPNCSSANEKEVLTFQIPLNDTGSAGLGVSVKGKTETSSQGQQIDSGIFVKSVIHGGAASKDGRLKQDDQLVIINGISLSRMTNSEATETLRKALIQSEDSTITLTIARRVNMSSDGSSYPPSNEAYNESNLDTSFVKYSGDNSSSPLKLSNDSSSYNDDSYRSGENTVIYNASARVDMTNMGQHETTEDKSPSVDAASAAAAAVFDQLGSSKSLNESEMSIDDAANERFRRDGLGRQSISEKRHAQLDAKNTDTYRKSKQKKESGRESSASGDSQLQQTIGQTPTSKVIRDLYGEDEQAAHLDISHHITGPGTFLVSKLSEN